MQLLLLEKGTEMSKAPKVASITISKIDEDLAALTGDVLPAYEVAYQAHWKTLTDERRAKEKMSKAGRQFVRRVRRMFKRVMGAGVLWGSLGGIDYDPECGFVVAHGQNPCKKRPYLTASIWVHKPHLQLIMRIPMGSGQEIADSALRIRRLIEAYLEGSCPE